MEPIKFILVFSSAVLMGTFILLALNALMAWPVMVLLGVAHSFGGIIPALSFVEVWLLLIIASVVKIPSAIAAATK